MDHRLCRLPVIVLWTIASKLLKVKTKTRARTSSPSFRILRAIARANKKKMRIIILYAQQIVWCMIVNNKNDNYCLPSSQTVTWQMPWYSLVISLLKLIIICSRKIVFPQPCFRCVARDSNSCPRICSLVFVVFVSLYICCFLNSTNAVIVYDQSHPLVICFELFLKRQHYD